MIVLGRRPLETGLAEHLEHNNADRPNRSLGQRAPFGLDTTPERIKDPDLARPRRTDRLGGLVHEYRMAA
jgi:hypothetical protein